MMVGRWVKRLVVIGGCVVVTSTGCAFHGVNSLPLPGAVGRGPGANAYRAEIANVGTLESNSPVLIDDVVVGSVGKMTFTHWHADVEFSVRPDVIVPANSVASIGQTSLLGSMHLALEPPLGQAPSGRLEPGATIPLTDSSTAPSTEQTLSSLSAVVNGGALGQFGDIIHNLNAALSGRGDQIRDLLTRLDTFVGTLDQQRDNIIAAIQALDRLANTFAAQRDVISQALRTIPPALDVLLRERPRITTALDKLRVFSDTAARLVNDTQADLVQNLQNLAPTIRSLADVGPGLDFALAYATVAPYGQDLIDRGLRGDYMNLFDQLDLTIPRLKRGLFLGTRFGQEGAPIVPAPGEPEYLNYTYDPLGAAVNPPPVGGTIPPTDGAPGPVPPVPPPGSLPSGSTPPPAAGPAGIFAGPYGSSPPPADTPAAAGGG
jgi:phospholipid/cholesterol/gamma-HCH transport system substrate-binding protein